MGIEEEGQLRGEFIHLQACLNGSLDIGNGVRQGESHFLDSRGTGFADMVTGDGDGVPARDVFGAELKDIGYQAQGWGGRKI